MRFTYRDRRAHGHSPFWAAMITVANHPIFSVALLVGAGVALALSLFI